MKKKTRIIGSISALALSTAMLTCGVLAASTVNLDVSSSVSFEAKGVYVKVNGQIQKGETTSSLVDAIDTTGTDYKYIGYSYDAVTEQTETGQTATTYDDTPVGSVSNSTMTGWSIGTIEFDETNKVIRYNFTFTNYSEFPISATIKNYSTADDSTPAITETFAAFGETVTVEESLTGGVIEVPAKTEATPGTANYSITLTLNNFGASLSHALALNFEFEKYEPKPIEDLTFTVNNYKKTATVTGFVGSPTNITIPSSISVVDGQYFNNGDILVTEIASSAFRDCSSLQNVVIKDGLEKIGTHAFRGCSALQNISMPDSINSIEGYAFYGCANLEELVLPKGLTEIKNSTFYNCTNLQSITIPESIVDFGASAFYNCTKLFYIEDNITYLKNTTADGENKYFAVADADSSITSANIKTGCKVILPSAFSGCSSLKNITIPEGITFIGDDAFSTTSITDLVIPEGVTTIGTTAFNFVSELTTITLPSSIKSIGGAAFKSCSNIENVYYNGSIEDWIEIEFGYYGTAVGESNPLYCAPNFYINNTLVSSLTIPEGVSKICDYAFYGYKGLKDLVLPSSLKTIGNEAFAKCSNLNSILVDSNNPYFDSRENCNAIISTSSNSLILGANNTTIPSSVKRIEEYAFYGRTFSNITIPNGVTYIGDYAFYGCKNLTSIILPDSVTHVGNYSFSYCSEVTNLKLSNKLRDIWGSAFSGLGITSLIIPKSVTYMADSCFSSCRELKTVIIGSNVKRLDSEVFSSCTKLTKVFIPSSVKTIRGSSVYDTVFNYAPTNIVISCEASTKPSGWFQYWNVRRIDSRNNPDGYCTVKWGVTLTSFCSGLGHFYGDILTDEEGKNYKVCEVCGNISYVS